jgi:predicted hydrocarbon binding protein
LGIVSSLYRSIAIVSCRLEISVSPVMKEIGRDFGPSGFSKERYDGRAGFVQQSFVLTPWVHLQNLLVRKVEADTEAAGMRELNWCLGEF